MFSHLLSRRFMFYLYDLYLLRRGVWAPSLTPPPIFKVPVPNKKSERSCICVIGVSMFPISTIILFEFGIVPAVW